MQLILKLQIVQTRIFNDSTLIDAPKSHSVEMITGTELERIMYQIRR